MTDTPFPYTTLLPSALVADHHQRVAHPVELPLQPCRVEPLPLDDEDGAVAVPRQLLVDRVQADRLELLWQLRQLFARHSRGQPADELEQPDRTSTRLNSSH